MIDARQALAQGQVAMMLLTRLPAGNLSQPIPKLADSAWAFPLVGLIVGGASALGLAGAIWAGLPASLAAGIAIIVGVLATGGLHEDGLADLADGFGGGQTRDRKLEIMRDSRIGSYGTLALILSVGLRWQAVAAVAAVNGPFAIGAVVAIAAVSRAGLPVMMHIMPAARVDGLGRSAAGVQPIPAMISAAIGVAAALVLLGFGTGLWVIFAVAVCLLALGAIAMRQIGGQTGDVLGAGQQLGEIAAWLVVTAAVTA